MFSRFQVWNSWTGLELIIVSQPSASSCIWNWWIVRFPGTARPMLVGVSLWLNAFKKGLLLNLLLLPSGVFVAGALFTLELFSRLGRGKNTSWRNALPAWFMNKWANFRSACFAPWRCCTRSPHSIRLEANLPGRSLRNSCSPRWSGSLNSRPSPGIPWCLPRVATSWKRRQPCSADFLSGVTPLRISGFRGR